MVLKLVILLSTTTLLISAFPKDGADNYEDLNIEKRQNIFLIQQPLDDQQVAQQTQKEEKSIPSLQAQQVYQPNGYGTFQYVEPQYQYPVYNQQAFPRIQPSILVYGSAGQGQPILINPGSPPGNFLVPQPQQPGFNVFLRGNPQPPVFVGGFPNPKPAHIPPIEKDAEEIPTNPSSIPPFPSTTPQDKKPEKLETFNEDKPQQPRTIEREPELVEKDGTPQLQFPVNRNQLKPGQRFFILNGEPLYQNYAPFNYPEDPNLAFQQVDQSYQQLQDGQRQPVFNYNEPLFVRNLPFTQQIPVQNPINLEDPNQNQQTANPSQNGQQYTQNFVPITQQNIPQEASLRGNLPNLIQINQQEPLFRTNFPSGGASNVPVAQFRYTPPNNSYFPLGDDPENDGVVINASFDDVPNNTGVGGAIDNQQAISILNVKSTDPSTAQAAPGAIALAGPGGLAGAAPKATALAGKGGLAVSSPKATAIAGTKEQDNKEKVSTKEQRPTTKPKHKQN